MLALGGVATVTESCNKEFLTPLYSKDFAEDKDSGQSLLPMNVYLPDGININGMIQFSRDALSKPNFKQAFYSNPKEVLSQYGIESYDIDSPQIQVILASVDPDVQKKIKDRDFKGYLHILEQKKYLQTEVVRQLTTTINKGIPMDTKSIEDTYDCVLMIPIVLGAAAIVAVAAAMMVATWAHVATYTDLVINGDSKDGLPILSEEAIMLYLDETKNLNTKDITEEEYIAIIRDIFSGTNITNNPETANKLFQYGCGTTEYLINNSTNE